MSTKLPWNTTVSIHESVGCVGLGQGIHSTNVNQRSYGHHSRILIGPLQTKLADLF